ncbi:TlpA family protein disulfide reductase [Ilumatobacter sp.]|uniref:TlpA family protein disulfide reductase n=1 Tax=Ilumatobacter sp. TaxID=1967498 RepID=UPI003B517611
MSDDTGAVVVDRPVGDGDEPGSARSRSRIAPWVALGVAVVMIALIVLLVGADSGRLGPSAETSLMNRPAPEAVGTLGDGTPFDLSRRKGSWVVINFFQSSCVPCIREHPELIEFVDAQRSLGESGAEFYSVVSGDTQANVEAFFAERGGDWPVVYSEGDSISTSFGVSLVPETWIVDPDGIVRFRAISEVTAESLAVVLQQLREALR